MLLAYGPNTEPLPEPELSPPLPPLGWEEAFLRTARPAPASVVESFGWMHYRIGPSSRQVVREQVTGPLLNSSVAHTPAWHRFVLQIVGAFGIFRFPPTDPDAGSDVAAMQASALLALCAARQAIIKDPQHPEPYFALAEALKDSNLPLSESERALGQAIAYRQCLDRLPKPDRYWKGQYNVPASDVAKALADLYLGPSANIPLGRGNVLSVHFVGMPVDLPGLRKRLGDMIVVHGDMKGMPVVERIPLADPNNPSRLVFNPNARQLVVAGPTMLPLDAAREMLELSIQYAEIDLGGDDSIQAREAKDEKIKKLQKRLDLVKTELRRPTQQYHEIKSRQLKLRDLVAAARITSQPKLALELLSNEDTDYEKEYGPGVVQSAILRVALELAVGKLENANEYLNGSRGLATLDTIKQDPAVQFLKFQTALQAGQYKSAGTIQEGMTGAAVGLEPLLAELAKNKVKPENLRLVAFASRPLPTIGAGLIPTLVFREAVSMQAIQVLRRARRYCASCKTIPTSTTAAASSRFSRETSRAPSGVSSRRNANRPPVGDFPA